MQAVILAGGLGTRLMPLTGQIPKVLVPVNGKPFLGYLLQLLKRQGVVDIVLCIGYLGQQIKDFCRDGKELGVKIKYSEEGDNLLGTGGALKQAMGLVDEHFFVINGDTYMPVNYTDVENTFLKRGKKALMVVYDNKEAIGVRSNVGLDDDLLVARYSKEKADHNMKYVEAGVLVLDREILGLIDEGCPVSMEKGLYPALIQQGELAAYTIGERFYDIGTLEQLKIFEQYLPRELK